MAHDVFISYAFEDKPTADAVCAELEASGVRCWIAPRDILPGIVFSEAIIHAINGSRLLVLVFSARSNESPHVMREVERAVNRGLPVIPLRIEKVPLSPSMEYWISTPHWLDALTPPLKKHLGHLAETVRLLLERGRQAEASATAAAGPAHLVRPTADAPIAVTGATRVRLSGPTGLLAGGFVAAVAMVAVVATSLGGGGVSVAATSTPGSGASGAVGFDTPFDLPTATAFVPGTLRIPTPTPDVPGVIVEPGFKAPGSWVGGIAWDGDDVWVAGGSELFRTTPDGRVLGVFEPPDYSPEGLAWDGSRFWLFTTNAGAIYRFSVDESRPAARPSVAKVIDSPIRTIGGGANHALAWDGESLWLSDFFSLHRLAPDGTVLDTLAFGDEIVGLAWDGDRLWLAFPHWPGDATIEAIDPTGTVTERHELPLVEISSMTWTGDAFLVAGLFEMGGETMIYRVERPVPGDGG